MAQVPPPPKKKHPYLLENGALGKMWEKGKPRELGKSYILMLAKVSMDLQRRRTWGLAQKACKSTIPLQPQHCHSSMSPSMSSTGTWEHGCELLGGAAERVTRSVGGTQSQSIWASKGNTSCTASSRASPRVLLFGTFTPMLAKQSEMRARVQSRNVPNFAAHTNLACARAKARFGSDFRGATASSSLLFSAASAASSTTYTTASPHGLGSLTKHVWQTRHVLHQMRTDCLHIAQSMPLRKVKKSWLPPC